MCVFSGSVDHVGSTRILAASLEERQSLVYQMSLSTARAVAMILPVPTPPDSAQSAVQFIDLSGYPELFDHVEAAFPVPRSSSFVAQSGAALPVHRVGDFIASFVPSLDGFERLDRRFRLPSGLVDAVPAYRDYGFVVFQLAESGGLLDRLLGRAQTKDFHPMAFTFVRRDPSVLFFPTVHVHDGAVHEQAAFDHLLYAQCDRCPEGWPESPGGLEEHASMARACGALRPGPVSRRRIVGTHLNADVTVPS